MSKIVVHNATDLRYIADLLDALNSGGVQGDNTVVVTGTLPLSIGSQLVGTFNYDDEEGWLYTPSEVSDE